MSKQDASSRRYRSGEAAKLARMPAATLRIWEQRYGVICPPTSESGQRLYSDDDVHRLRLLKALVGRGHAIGSIARLEGSALEALATSKAKDKPLAAHGSSAAAITIIAVGLGELEPNECISASFGSLDALLRSSAATRASGLIARVAALHPETVDQLAEAATRIGASEVTVVFPFGTQEAIQLAALQGMTLRKRPDGLLRADELLAEFTTALRQRNPGESSGRGLWLRSARRFDDATLARLVRLSTTIACECPKHLAELIMQLSAFEGYSDQCLSRSPADALLHRHLGDTANRAVRMFEDALAEVAQQEGWDVMEPPSLAT
ncbi:MerR family transcriptional regulator [Paraburkholderia sp. A2WS-5]|uniref:MerR family transcriptional regulator n=1 Tax=unclassified Paraburkholderia TaxID=2615204 RepID=UPI003B7A049D